VGSGPIFRIGENDKAPAIIAHIEQAGSLLGLRYVELSDVRYWVNSGRHIFNSSSSGFDPQRSAPGKLAKNRR